jgi:hypothetical protein
VTVDGGDGGQDGGSDGELHGCWSW